MKSFMLSLFVAIFSLYGISASAIVAGSGGTIKPSVGETLHTMAGAFAGSAGAQGSFTNFVPVNVLHYCTPNSLDSYGNKGCLVPKAGTFAPVCPKGATLVPGGVNAGVFPYNSWSTQANKVGYMWYTCNERLPLTSVYYATLQSQNWTTCQNPQGGDNPIYQCSIVVTVPPIVNFQAPIRPAGSYNWAYGCNPNGNGCDGTSPNHWHATERNWGRDLWIANIQIDVYPGDAGWNVVPAVSGFAHFIDNPDALGYNPAPPNNFAQVVWALDTSNTPKRFSGTPTADIQVYGPVIGWGEYQSSMTNNDGTWGYYFCDTHGQDHWGSGPYDYIKVPITSSMLGKTCTVQCPQGYWWANWWDDHWFAESDATVTCS